MCFINKTKEEFKCVSGTVSIQGVKDPNVGDRAAGVTNKSPLTKTKGAAEEG